MCVTATLAVLLPMALVASSAMGTVVAKSKPQVKLSGKVNKQGEQQGHRQRQP